ncbi:glycosyltransferase [Ahniella affigens]|nr:glycosyltransferase [Ahniella affigens]
MDSVLTSPAISVLICAHNPDLPRLARVLAALAAQTLPMPAFEVLIIDNGSTPALQRDTIHAPPTLHLRIVPEPRLGLSEARATGFLEAKAPILVLVDDDNGLSPNYLADACAYLDAHADIGALGGPCLPEFDGPIPPFANEFLPLLALRDLGPEIQSVPGQPGQRLDYPLFAPMGAGMVLRTTLAVDWAAAFRRGERKLMDRRGKSLSSAGDNDIVLHLLAKGQGVAYLPALRVTHILSIARLEVDYLRRLNLGIQQSWMQVLRFNGVSPWPPISRLGAWLRIARAYVRYQAWRGPVQRIRFAGAKGHFLGRVP